MSIDHLNLRFTVAHVDKIVAMAKAGYSPADIVAVFSREHFPATVDEIVGICRDAFRPVRQSA